MDQDEEEQPGRAPPAPEVLPACGRQQHGGQGGQEGLAGHYRYHTMLANVVVVVCHTNVQVAGGSVTKVAHLLVTPRVRREVRAHFGCRGAQGGELEDQVKLLIVFSEL